VRTRLQSSTRGVALIVVMVAIFVLSVLVGAFALSMKVETKLAMNANRDVETTWLGRSGVELARYVLVEQTKIAGEPYDSLNQKWAGGPGSLNTSNSPLANISLDNYQIGNAMISVKIKDLERKFNVNVADERIFEQALTLVGVDAGEIPRISASILDWIDTDDLAHVNGAESDDYQVLDPPYMAKNRPIDDLSELLLINGITQEMYWGPAAPDHIPAHFQKVDRFGRAIEVPTYAVGLYEILTPISSGKLNINTASATSLQIIPLMDANVAAEIVKLRSGPDGAEGTEDDTPFRSVGELRSAGLGNLGGQAEQMLSRFCDVRSQTFEVEVHVSGSRRTYFAILGRTPPRNVQILNFYWKDQ
jgi:hypothetical protein